MGNTNLDNATLLITGGTGSFGSKMLAGVLNSTNIKEIRVFSRDELKQEHMRIEVANPKVKFYIGDVRDRASVDNAMRGVDLVFHAAALKQVPSCEFFPMQAVLTNVTGSHNVVESAIEHGVKSVVMLSTDKAVCPINAMGMTKALMEKVAQAAARHLGDQGPVISSVRYGNVMCSRGSVIPLFVKQIQEGRPITITEGSMTRFMMSLESAIDLVIFALDNASQGDIFVRKAPACTVQDLAQALMELFQKTVPIKTIGVRHGEKLFETLATREELLKSEDLGNHYRLRMDGRDLNVDKYFTEGATNVEAEEDYTSHNTVRLNVEQTKQLLLTLPEINEALAAWKP